MAISTQYQNLNLIPGKSAPVVVHCSQGNVGDTVGFYLYDGDEPFYPTNVSIAVHGVRADGSVFGPYAVSTSVSSNLVTFELRAAMTSVAGAAIGELVITDSGENQIGTANFGILVEAAPYSSSVTYEDDLSIYQRILAYVQSIPGELSGQIAAEAATRAEEDSKLMARDDQLESSITTERSDRIASDEALQTDIEAEAEARAAADNNLQSQINQYVTPSTEQPTEVVNARVGINGETYPTLKARLDAEESTLNSAILRETGIIQSELNDVFNTKAGTITRVFNLSLLSGFIRTDGTTGTGGYYHSQMVPVSQGDTVTFRNQNGVSSMRFVTAYQGQTVQASSGAESITSYTVPAGVTGVVVSFSSGATIGFLDVSSTEEKITTLKEAVRDRHSNDSLRANYSFIFPYDKIDGKAITASGAYSDVSGYFTTKPVPVYPKQCVEIRSSVASTSYAVFAISTRDGDIVEVKTRGGSAGDFTVRWFNNSKDTAYVVASSQNELNFYIKIINCSYKAEEVTARTMFRKTDGTEVNTSIITADGISSNYCITTPFKLNRGETINLTALVSDSIPAIIKTDEYGATYNSAVTGTGSQTVYQYTATDEIEYLMVQYKDSNPYILNVANSWNNDFNMDARKGTVCFIFDDGVEKDAEVFDMFNDAKLKCGFALISSIFADVRSKEYLKYQSEGFSILAHSTDATAMSDGTIDPATIETKMRTSYHYLMRRGFDIKGWVTPSSQLAEVFKSIPKRHFSYAYTNYYGTYSGQATRPYNTLDERFELYRVDCNSSLESMKSAVDMAVENAGFLTFYYHAASMDAEHKSRIIDLLSYINTLIDLDTIRCLAPNEAFAYYYNLRVEDLT